MLIGNEAGRVGMEDSAGDAYEDKTGLGLLDSGQPTLPSKLQKFSSFPHTCTGVSTRASHPRLGDEGEQGPLCPAFSLLSILCQAGRCRAFPIISRVLCRKLDNQVCTPGCCFVDDSFKV